MFGFTLASEINGGDDFFASGADFFISGATTSSRNLGAATAWLSAVAYSPSLPSCQLPTAHPPVPMELSSMWLVPSQGAKLSPAMTNFVRGVRCSKKMTSRLRRCRW